MKVIPKIENVNSDFLSEYLTSCGITDIEKYLNPDDSCFDNPFDYPNMYEAIDIFWSYIMSHEKIGYNVGIIMDSDMDGACSAAIMYLFCKELGITPTVFSHEGKQHGCHDLMQILTSSNVDLLFIPDAGTNDVEDCKILKELGKEVIILDHHEIEKPNNNATIVNHHLGENLNTALSGAGVTYKFVEAFCTKYNRDIPNYNDLVAISLISDVCNLTSLENRAYLSKGMNQSNNNFINLLYDTVCKKDGVNPKSIAWSIAPLGNALSRSDEQETKLLFFKALITEADYDAYLKEIRRVKRNQDNAVKAAVEEIESTIDTSHKIIIGFSDDSNKNYLGLIANKFCGKTNKPTILLRELSSTVWTGSLRSPIALASKINESKLGTAQGHEEACGITIKKSNMNKFIKWIDNLDLSETPDIPVTACVSPKTLNNKLMEIIADNKKLWGKGIDEPTFYIKTTASKDNVFVYEKKTTTLKVQFGDLSCLKFSAKEEDVEAFTKYNKFNLEIIVGSCSTNEYNGIVTPQCHIIDYEINPINDEIKEEWDELF